MSCDVKVNVTNYGDDIKLVVNTTEDVFKVQVQYFNVIEIGKEYFDTDIFFGKYTADHDADWLILNPPGSINNPWTINAISPPIGGFPYTLPLTLS